MANSAESIPSIQH